MSGETCPACNGIAMSTRSKYLEFKGLKCRACGEELRLSIQWTVLVLLLAFLLSGIVTSVFSMKGFVAIGLSMVLVWLPGAYFIPLEKRK